MTAPTKGSRVTGRAREQLAERLRQGYQRGKTIRQLAQETGRSLGSVHAMLEASGVTLRAQAAGDTKWVGDEKQLIRELKKGYDMGMSLRELADNHGCSYGFVRRRLIKNGVTLRKRGSGTPTEPASQSS